MAPWNNDNGDIEMLRSVVYRKESNEKYTVECWEDDRQKRKECTPQELSRDPWPATTESDDEEEARLNELDEEDLAVAIEDKTVKHYYEHEFKSRKRKRENIDKREDPDWRECRRRRCTYEFDIPKILKQEADGGTAAAARYNREVFWKKDDTRRIRLRGIANVGSSQAFDLLGHVYKLEVTSDDNVLIGKCVSKSKRCRWECEAWFQYLRKQTKS